MAKKKSPNKRRPRARERHAGGAKQTPARGFSRTVGLIAAGIVAIIAVGGAVAFFVNSSAGSSQVLDIAAGSVPSSGADFAVTSAKIGTRVGNKIPDVQLRLIDGSTISTNSLIEDGKPTFLFFFATW